MKTHPSITLVGLLGFALPMLLSSGCARAPLPPEARGVSVEKADSPAIEVHRPRLLADKGNLLLGSMFSVSGRRKPRPTGTSTWFFWMQGGSNASSIRRISHPAASLARSAARSRPPISRLPSNFRPARPRLKCVATTERTIRESETCSSLAPSRNPKKGAES